MKCIKTFAFVLLGLSLFASQAVAAGGSGTPYSPFDIDKLEKAPDFALRDLGGKNVSIASYKGKVVLINFWATWCPSCTAEMPSLNELYKALRERGLEVIAVSTDRSEGIVREYLKKKKYAFTVVMDESKTVTRQYKVFSIPTTFLIDKTGTIVEKFFGEYEWTDREIREKIEKQLEK